MDLKTYQTTVDSWVMAHGGYFSPLSMLAQLTEETGEIARIVNRTYGEQTFKKSDKDKDLGDEIAGTLFALTCLANKCDIDLNTVLQKHLDKITARDVTRFEKAAS